jgi:hypothetical protein
MPRFALAPLAASLRVAARIALALVATFAPAPAVEAQSPAVRITREAPVVTRTEVDPLHPPPNAPSFDARESGLCRATFEVRTLIGYTTQAGPRRTLRVIPTSVEVVTHLALDIYVLEGAAAKVHAHEETHRAISEHYYRDAAAIARTLAEALIGKPVTATGATRDVAEKSAFDALVAGYNEAYFARTRALAYAANERFDEITDHGRAAVTEAEAFARALEIPVEPGRGIER